MSFDEVSFRSKAVLAKKIEEWCYRVGLDRNPEAQMVSENKADIVFNYPWLGAQDQKDSGELLKSIFPDYVQKIKITADKIRNHHFTFFATDFKYDAKIPWMADPVSGQERPRVFYTKVDIFGGDTGKGDVKYVWELNRHQFIPTLGKAYCLSGDEQYAEEGLNLIIDWIESNPYKVGINWSSALEVAVRALAWAWACAFFEPSPHFTLEKRKVIVRSFYQHGLFLENHLSFFFSPYNHLIGEASALFVIGSLLPFLKPSARWRERGWQILEDEMPKQLHSDGGTVEQATGYHHFTMGFYLQAILLKRQAGGKIVSDLWSLFEKSFDYALHMTRPDGEIPMMGDGDEGIAITLDQPSLWDFRPFLAIGAVLFKRGDLKKMAGPFSPDTLWLIGKTGWEILEKLEEKTPSGQSYALPSSGYFVMRSGWDQKAHYLNFDCGELADGVQTNDMPSAAHGHADALSIELSVWGSPFLVDPGFYTYNGAIKWHRYFRETAAHNTVVIDDQSQAEYCGRMTWKNGPHVTLRHWVTSKQFDYAEGRHDGYTHLPQSVIHQRAVLFLKPRYWLVRDVLSGKGTHQIDRYFHCGPHHEADCDEKQKSVQIRSPEGSSLLMIACENENLLIKIKKGGSEPDEGWIALGYEKKIEAPVICFRTKMPVPTALHTLLVPFSGEPSDVEIIAISVETEDQPLQTSAFMVKILDQSDVFFFGSGTHMVSFHEGYQTDATLACIRLDGEDKIKSCFIMQGTTLNIEGKGFLKLDRAIRYAILCLEKERPCLEVSESVGISTSFSNLKIDISPSGNGLGKI